MSSKFGFSWRRNRDTIKDSHTSRGLAARLRSRSIGPLRLLLVLLPRLICVTTSPSLVDPSLTTSSLTTSPPPPFPRFAGVTTDRSDDVAVCGGYAFVCNEPGLACGNPNATSWTSPSSPSYYDDDDIMALSFCRELRCTQRKWVSCLCRWANGTRGIPMHAMCLLPERPQKPGSKKNQSLSLSIQQIQLSMFAPLNFGVPDPTTLTPSPPLLRLAKWLPLLAAGERKQARTLFQRLILLYGLSPWLATGEGRQARNLSHDLPALDTL